MKSSILIGSLRDPQVRALKAFAGAFLAWEEWGNSWQISVTSGDVRLDTFANGELLQSYPGESSHVYIRYPGCPEAAESEYLALISFHPDCKGVARPGQAPTDKLSQLALFGEAAPRTLVSNEPERLLAHKDWICKNISPLRSVASELAPMAADLGEARLAIPVLLQERLEGQEYKAHFIKLGPALQSFNVRIVKSQAPTDYRYQGAGFLAVHELSLHPKVRAVAEALRLRGGCDFWDMDYFIGPEGQVKILEWNDSPESATFEARCRLDQKFAFSRLALAPTEIVFIGARNDRVLDILGENCEIPAAAVRLDCEEYGRSWHFSLENGALCFYRGEEPLIPSGIYLRPVNVPGRLIQIYDDLFRSIELWEGPTIGKMRLGFYNSSKIFQTHETLRKARALSGTEAAVGFPRSWFIKADPERLTELVEREPELIVKSCSGTRSVVVDQSEFSRWDSAHLANIPTLFQETIRGADLRIHSLKGKPFAIRVDHKDSVDYRYAAERAGFSHFQPSEAVRRFCEAVGQVEQNPLLGLDFLEHNERLYCLEANPCPGWNWYYNKSTCAVNELAQGILKELSHATQV